jgi:hypothetical protein
LSLGVKAGLTLGSQTLDSSDWVGVDIAADITELNDRGNKFCYSYGRVALRAEIGASSAAPAIPQGDA